MLAMEEKRARRHRERIDISVKYVFSDRSQHSARRERQAIEFVVFLPSHPSFIVNTLMNNIVQLDSFIIDKSLFVLISHISKHGSQTKDLRNDQGSMNDR